LKTLKEHTKEIGERILSCKVLILYSILFYLFEKNFKIYLILLFIIVEEMNQGYLIENESKRQKIMVI
jgi:hypothetical protein